ncbi:MAG: RNHCP domain-containing protein [Candidatus Brocadiae bacterium]|nr:RNHCP domain-containing protein [Candidatus Brocadiia bacterium]
MSKSRKINDGFLCLYCGAKVSPVEKTCRNHCPECLYSLHVDGDTPGDRESSCHSLMEPIRVEKTGKGYSIIHRCMKCKKIHKNKTAEDDCWEKIIEISV